VRHLKSIIQKFFSFFSLFVAFFLSAEMSKEIKSDNDDRKSFRFEREAKASRKQKKTTLPKWNLCFSSDDDGKCPFTS
jgi:hypothetical protein